MAEPFTEYMNGGVVTSRDPTHLSAGELQRAIGCWYKPGDRQRLHKQRGRVVFGDTGTGEKVKGVKVLQFDSGGVDRLVALSGSTLYGAPSPGPTGSFAALKSGLDSTATRLSAAQYSDRWFLTTDGDDDRVFVIDNAGTVYDAGMYPYTVAPGVAVAAAGGTVIRPGATAGDILSSANTNDTDTDTFGAFSLSAIGSQSQTWTWSTGASAARDLIVKWALQGIGLYGDEPFQQRTKDSGGVVDSGAVVTVKFEFSSDNGSTYTTLKSTVYRLSEGPQTFQYAVGTVNPGATPCILRATYEYIAGQSTMAWRIYDVRLQTGSATTNFATSTGLFYACTEFDELTGERSPVKATTDLVTLAASNQVTLTRPTLVNSRATHWEIWRTSDGGTAPYDLGLLAQVPIAQTTYKDDFVEYDRTVSPPRKLPLLQVTVDNGSIYIEQDQPPPNLDRIMSFQNSLIGIKGRELRYALAGLPGSWPEIYGIGAFESEEHDELVTGADLGELFILGGVANLRRISSLPRVAIGNFAFSPPEIIPGAPGCVGAYAMTRFAIGGQPMVAWISHYGIFQTNGYQVQRISDDWDWGSYEPLDKSGWVIQYDPERYLLIVSYATGGTTNNRYALGHVHPDHIKGNQPKWTLDHYGSINDMASARVGNARRLYSAHVSDGKVYTEDYGTTDESNSYDSSGTWPMLITLRKFHGGGKEFAALKAWLRHSDCGAQSMSVGWTVGRDESASQTKTVSVSLAQQKRTMFDVARGGEWHEVTLTHTGDAAVSIGELSFEMRPLGGAGEVKVA